MEQLNYEVLKKLGYKGYILEDAPEKVLQFGEGNFLRGFVQYWFDVANERTGWNGKCALMSPRSGRSCPDFDAQQSLYTLYLRGRENGERVDRKRVISCVSRCLSPKKAEDVAKMMKLAVSDELEFIVSNTTEAGIVYDPSCNFTDCPASSFPGKLTQVLYERFKAGKGGLVMLSCELIDNNGKELQKCVNQYALQWGLGEDFISYVNNDCLFCSTLVDRIVTGKIRDEAELQRMAEENGYTDVLYDIGEVFGVWIIEGPAWLEEKLPFKAAGLDVHVVPDVTPYKKRKVRILNGAHTGFVLGAYLAGFDIVRDCMHDDTVRGFMNKMLYDEVIPTLPLDRADLESFTSAVQDRFDNPFIDHELMAISLNSTSKWCARNMPSLLEYVALKNELPACLSMSLAAYIAFYSNDIQELNDSGLVCRRAKGNTYTCSDDRWVLDFYYAHRDDSAEKLVHSVLTNERMWGMDLTSVSGLETAVLSGLNTIRSEGALAAFASCL